MKRALALVAFLPVGGCISLGPNEPPVAVGIQSPPSVTYSSNCLQSSHCQYYLYVNDGKLLRVAYAEGNSVHSGVFDYGRPSGVRLSSSHAPAPVDDGGVRALAIGEDGNLWQVDATTGWTNVGRYSNSDSISTAPVPMGENHIWVVASNGKLWEAWKNNGAWNWSQHNNGLGWNLKKIAPITIDETSVFAVDNKGRLKEFFWNGANWNWSNRGRPTSRDITGLGGHDKTLRKFRVFSDLDVNELWWDQSSHAWQWAQHGAVIGQGNGSFFYKGEQVVPICHDKFIAFYSEVGFPAYNRSTIWTFANGWIPSNGPVNLDSHITWTGSRNSNDCSQIYGINRNTGRHFVLKNVGGQFTPATAF